MGLDGVELVMEVEDRFGVRLLDAECQQVRTVADLAALVIARLPGVSGVCPTARAFYQVRRLLVDHAGVERGLIRPDTLWEELFPGDLPRVWRALAALESRWPRLEHSPRVAAAAPYLGLIAVFGTLGGTAAAWHQFGVMAGVLALTAGLALFATVRGVLDPLRTCVPVGLECVGQLAMRWGGASSSATSVTSPGQRLIEQQRVLAEVRKIAAEQLGLPLEQVRAESNFVKDLGLD